MEKGENLYILLSTDSVKITYDSGKPEIQKAYHKKVLECHPDKFPGDKAKAELFQRVQTAYDLLLDDVERAKYDAIQRGLQNRKRKLQSEDTGRQKMREELERKEKMHKDKTDQKNRKAEEDLAKQESAQLIDQLLRAGHLRNSKPAVPTATEPAATEESPKTIVVKWKSSDKKDSELNEEDLRSIFKVYGAIEDVVLKTELRKARALVVFASALSAERALTHPKTAWNFSISLPKRKDKSKRASSVPSTSQPSTPQSSSRPPSHSPSPLQGASPFGSPITRMPSKGKSAFGVSPGTAPAAPSQTSQDDYEKETLRRMQEFAKKQHQ